MQIFFSKLGLIVFSLILVSFYAFNSDASQPLEKQRLPLPPLHSALNPSLGITDTQETSSAKWAKYSIKIPKNGSLSEALDDLGVSKTTAFEIKKLPNSRLLTQLRVGDTLNIWVDQDRELQKIDYPKTRATHYQLTRSDNGFKIQPVEHPVEIKIASTAGIIKHSFYLGGQDAGLSANTIMNLADIFSWEIDFIRQLRPGDHFKVIYEKRFIDNKYVGDGDILAAEITTAGDDKHTAFLLRNAKGENIGYYDIHKHNLKKAFLRNPVDYVRITSTYKPMRFHPVLKKWRAHRGIDYGGPVGTPIHATGEGQIIRRGWSKSYGRVIYIKHAGKYTTVYAHMSKFGKFKKGQWVKQGQVIGYIGQSGLATGPHLHYELRISGHYVDPLKVKFPDAAPVPRRYRTQFVEYASLMHGQLSRINPHNTQLATRFE
ncbi:M23 family metallopeptidase [Hydrogenovibrio kuenenii]|uniref:M23 family metallopeptidase n=1 Tax=Hydrogenovibrio kuenenii TaxID=63658 RepID=UPI00046798DD|nr:peptidoglycan DD-metalloendopeptidase family protein [Hydrogenovibrio kuenenii]